MYSVTGNGPWQITKGSELVQIVEFDVERLNGNPSIRWLTDPTRLVFIGYPVGQTRGSAAVQIRTLETGQSQWQTVRELDLEAMKRSLQFRERVILSTGVQVESWSYLIHLKIPIYTLLNLGGAGNTWRWDDRYYGLIGFTICEATNGKIRVNFRQVRLVQLVGEM